MRCLLIALTIATLCLPAAVAQDVGFDETHDEMFVFVEISESLRKYGYSAFCTDTQTRVCRLKPYRKYVGKRGHFLSTEKIPGAFGHEYREVILETGEKLFFVSKSNEEDILKATHGDVAFVRDVEAAQSEVGKPFVVGSPVTILDAKSSFSRWAYYINAGEPFPEEKYKSAQRLLNSLTTREHDKELLEILQVSVVDWDRIEQRFNIRIAPFYVENDAGPIQASVVKTENSITLSGTARYSASSWLFVDRYVVVAGDTRYESPSLDFRRDNAAGKIWEWTTFTVDSNRRALLDAVASEPDAVVRFYGQDYYNDKEVSMRHRDALQKMLRLHDILSKYSK